MINTRHWGKILAAGLLWVILSDSSYAQMKMDSCISTSQAQMNMDPYFSTINYPAAEQSFMLMAMSDFQSARTGNNFITAMLMAEYGITQRWTIGAMIEGQKIAGLPVTYGGLRVSTYFHLFQDDRFLNLTLYGEYEELNGASLYKMEVAGLGSEDLMEPLAEARNTHVRTLEQRLIIYHDWDRLNLTFNFVRETALQSPFSNDYGYALGLFFMPSLMSKSMGGMSDMNTMPLLSIRRLGYGLEIIGALGNNQQFGFHWNAQQHYIGAVLMYNITSSWSFRLEPAFGLSDVSDPFMLRTGLDYMFGISKSSTMKMD